MFPRMLSQVAFRWVTVAALLASLSGVALAGGRPGPRQNAAQYRDRKAVYQQRALNQAGRYEKTGNFKQHVWSEANKIRAHAEELKARAAASTNPAEKKQLWEKAQGLYSKADALTAQVRGSSSAIKPAEPGIKALPAPKIAGALPAPENAGALPAPRQPAGLLTAGSEAPRTVGVNIRKASAATYRDAKRAYENARAQSEAAKARGDHAAARAHTLDMARNKVVMLESQAQGRRAKADQAKAAGNPDLANQHIDNADQLSRRAAQITTVLNRLEKGAATGAAAAAVTPPVTPSPVAPAPEATNTTSQKPVAAEEQKQSKPPQVREAGRQENKQPAPRQIEDVERPVAARGQALPDRPGSIKKIIRQTGDIDSAAAVLERLQARAKDPSRNVFQRTKDRVQAAIASRTLRKELRRVVDKSVQPQITATIAAVVEAVSEGQLPVAAARQTLLQEFRADRSARNPAEMAQVDRAMAALLKGAITERASRPSRSLVGRALAGLVERFWGSWSRTADGTVKDVQKQAFEAVKDSRNAPERAQTAQMLLAFVESWAKTQAGTQAGIKVNAKKIQAGRLQAAHNLENTIKSGLKDRDPDPRKVRTAYDALLSLQLEDLGPKTAEKIKKIADHMEFTMYDVSSQALRRVARHMNAVKGRSPSQQHPEPMAEAAQFAAQLKEVVTKMELLGLEVPSDVKRDLRSTLKYLERQGLGWRILRKGWGFVKGVSLPLRLPFKVAWQPVKIAWRIARGKPIIRGNPIMESQRAADRLRSAAEWFLGPEGADGMVNVGAEAEGGAPGGGNGNRNAGGAQAAMLRAQAARNAQMQNMAR